MPFVDYASDENLIPSSTSAPLINSHQFPFREIDNMSKPFRSRTQENERVSEYVGCETALAGNEWMLCNFIDLFLSSAGPFGFLLPLNLSIIIQVSKQRRTSSRLASIGVRESVNAAKRGHPTGHSVSTRIQEVGSNSIRTIRNTISALADRDAIAERSVTLMLLMTTFTFLVMRTPIAVGHSVQMLLIKNLESIKKSFMVICMVAFAVAEMLAYGQHATLFYVYLVCSARFRQALCQQFRQVPAFIERFVNRGSESSTEIPQRPAIRLRSLNPHHPTPIANRSSSSHSLCPHHFLWAGQHLLVCRLCYAHRLVHHPSCVHFREENRFNCECRRLPRGHPAHIVVHLGDQHNPFFGMAYHL